RRGAGRRPPRRPGSSPPGVASGGARASRGPPSRGRVLGRASPPARRRGGRPTAPRTRGSRGSARRTTTSRPHRLVHERLEEAAHLVTVELRNVLPELAPRDLTNLLGREPALLRELLQEHALLRGGLGRGAPERAAVAVVPVPVAVTVAVRVAVPVLG